MGKLIAGFFGFILGSALHIGLFGLTFGLWLGHQFDEALKNSKLLWSNTVNTNSIPKLYQHFFGILGHIAKSDGMVSQKEIDIASALMAQLNLTRETQKKSAQKAFNNGKKVAFPFQSILMQIQIQCLINPNLKQLLIQSIVAMRHTDSPIHQNKERLIIFALQQLNVTFQQKTHQRAHQATYQPTPSQSDYKLLGVDFGVNKENLKKAYRRLMHKHHPDRLTAQGATDAEIKRATKKTQEIKAAYERISIAKGF